MTPEFVVDLAMRTFRTALLLSAPALIAGLVIGVVISIFQAITQIQEQTQAVHQLQLERKEFQNRIDSRHDSLVATREEWKRRLKEIAERLRNAEQARSERARVIASEIARNCVRW